MLVILGESGSGKTTLIKALTEEGSKFKRIVTYTTRPPRYGETDGIDYHFVEEGQFHRLDKIGFFAERMNYRGWFYGISKEDCMEDSAAAVLTPHGLRTMKKLGIPTTSIYLNVDRRTRLINMLKRGDDIEEAYRRNLTDVGEFDGVSDEVDFVINNPCFMLTPENVLGIAKEILFPKKKTLDGQTCLFEGEKT